MARPKKDIKAAEVEKLAGIGCTNEEIGTLVGCSVDTLTRRFADVLKKGRENMRMSLRRQQFKKATEGNTTMLIWLGKQYLGQTDKVEQTSGDLDAIIERELARIAAASEGETSGAVTANAVR